MNLTTFVLSSFALVVQKYADNYKAQDLSKTLKEMEGDYGFPKIQEYDFIVVGAGTAGCLLAGRLSEKNFTVLLLEKGGDPPPPTYTPIYNREIHDHPAINDYYYSTPQDFNGMTLPKTRTIVVSAGRLMGGSGSHNWLVYNRGSPLDYDNWAKLTNDSSWSYESMLQHFKRIENNRGFLINETLRNDLYGSGGPFTMETHGPEIPQFNRWFQAGEELGFSPDDSNGYQTESFSPLQTFAKGGIRESTYTAFIKPVEGERKNLFVQRYSHVDKVLIDPSKKAYGVAYKRHGIPQIAISKKEIILSAGTLVSPFILMKSGIGPRKLLQQMNIPLVVELPGVGENLQDHLMVWLDLKSNSANAPPKMGDKEFLKMTEDFHKNVSSNVNIDSAGTSDSKVQCHLVSKRAKRDGQSNWSDYQIQFGTNRLDESSVYAFIALMRQKSVGRLLINTKAFLKGETEESKLVKMDLRYFSDPTDYDVIIEGIQTFFTIIEKTEAFASKNYSITTKFSYECSFYPPRSYHFWKCFVAEASNTVWHIGGTCKMGQGSDPTAVVDSKLRVRGVKGLRVVDASVMPVITNSNINAAVIGLAEKASQDILQEYNESK